MVTTAIILAGGLGTRLKKVVQDLPKPMALIRGRPFLEYQMDFWISQGVTKFILSVGYLNHIIIDHFGDSYHTASINYYVEDEYEVEFDSNVSIGIRRILYEEKL